MSMQQRPNRTQDVRNYDKDIAHQQNGRDNRRSNAPPLPSPPPREYGINRERELPIGPPPPGHQSTGFNNTNGLAPRGSLHPSAMAVNVPAQSYSRMTVSELVAVPPELASFAADPKFQQILLKVKEQTAINFISLNRISDNCVESVAIDAPSRESASLARSLIETHFKLQTKLKAAESRLQKVQTDLFSAQGEIASGMMVEFTVSADLLGVIIGKKGSRIRQIEQETGVSSINVNGDTGKITIVGPDSSSVQRARESLELLEDSFELKPIHVQWLGDKMNYGVLADIKSISNLVAAKVNFEKGTLDVIGVHSAVRSARLMIATQLEYVDKQIEIEQNERNVREKLQAVRKQYGISSYSQRKGPDGEYTHNNGNYNNNNNGYNGNRYRKEGGGGEQHSTRVSANIATSKQDSLVSVANNLMPPAAPTEKQSHANDSSNNHNSNNNRKTNGGASTSASAMLASTPTVTNSSSHRKVTITAEVSTPVAPPAAATVTVSATPTPDNKPRRNNNRNNRPAPAAAPVEKAEEVNIATNAKADSNHTETKTSTAESMLLKINPSLHQKNEATAIDDHRENNTAGDAKRNGGNGGNNNRNAKRVTANNAGEEEDPAPLPQRNRNRGRGGRGGATSNTSAEAEHTSGAELADSLKNALKISPADTDDKEATKKGKGPTAKSIDGLTLREAMSITKSDT
mmetsp:Transcript_4701/g.6442  ORF Transcript_4701/g.6442 Transcript_4701/m.6442 type:complete len:690 (-) Transcript_4701:441-2510(-)|eukprot:CAMPEP_0170075960 /NCGR_PEP_ID=MMETSP0019_2-20121128/13015_1 /TAXON_ID=98059 /ORGANISM="Dinobryon sp., Strain UTEXLB2267" /LENGTH=689 /DNA_ID=CAMNT_0010287287 /DNA_START=30 /DNA_END=2099 /DNA_ORIENTATION=+